MKRWCGFAMALLVVVLSALGPSLAFAASSRDDVQAQIATLSEDPRDYTAADEKRVMEIEAAYEALSAEDQEWLDAKSGSGFSQPYGRVLESAVWVVKSLAAPDNTTTLVNGTYNETTVPALSSVYSKGKSTSPRDRPWSVDSVEVKDGKAFATISVDSPSYPSMTTGGKTYESKVVNNRCVFENIPIDLNSTFYFAGNSSSMPRPIMFSLTTEIFEPGKDSDTHIMSVTSETETFRAGDTALATLTNESVAGVETETLEVQLGMSDLLFDRVVYPSVINGELAEAEATLANGSFQLVLKNVGDVVSFKNGEPIAMKFRIALTGAWVEHQLTFDWDKATIAASGGYIGFDEVKALIEKLPSDPWKITVRDADAINLVSSVYEAMTSADRKAIDDEPYGRQSYGRALEQALWALQALNASDNSTTLADGEYSDGVKTTSSLGKGVSARNSTFEVKKVIAYNGKATALIQYSGTSADMVLTGGQVYRHVNTDESQPSEFEVPISLNETFYLVAYAKNPTENTVGITYAVTTQANEATMKPDKPAPPKPEDPDDDDDDDGGNDGGDKDTGGNGEQAAPTGSTPTGTSTPTITMASTPTPTAASATSARSETPRATNSSAPRTETGGAVSDGGDIDADDGELSPEALLAITVLLIAGPIVVLLGGAASFGIWFARKELSPVIVSSLRMG